MKKIYNYKPTGVSDCVLALGFEKMQRGSLGSKVTEIEINCNIYTPTFNNDGGAHRTFRG